VDRFVYPALFAILLWWISTGVVLRIVNLGRATHVVSFGAATILLGLGGLALYLSAFETGMEAAYIAFAAALLVWAWHEISFLTGLVTGPRTRGASAHENGRAPLGEAVASVIYHEFAIALTAAGVVILTAGGTNQTGLWTFLILWLSRLSTKINIYLGVPNVTEDFLPKHLAYIKSYFCRRPMNMIFPLSVTATTVAAVFTVAVALHPATADSQAAAATMLATLLLLALIEHWFLVLPFNSARLWSWAKHGGPALAGALELSQAAHEATAQGGVS